MRSSSLILLLLLPILSANQIFTPHSGGTFGRSSHEPKYKIDFHSAEAPYHPDVDQESMVMSDSKGKSFLCFLPTEEKPNTGKSASQHNTSGMIVETERPIKLKTPDELLELLRDKCLYRQEGWWSYEFCYQKRLRQLHLEDDKVVQEFVLGEYDAEVTEAFHQKHSDVSILKDPRSKDASQRYHAHQYTNGTICDLTNQPRETEIRFVCSEPGVMISSITELSTCKYALTVHSPMLCKHPMFKQERPTWHTINCNELPKNAQQSENEDGSYGDKQITMVTDINFPSSYDSEKFAT